MSLLASLTESAPGVSLYASTISGGGSVPANPTFSTITVEGLTQIYPAGPLESPAWNQTTQFISVGRHSTIVMSVACPSTLKCETVQQSLSDDQMIQYSAMTSVLDDANKNWQMNYSSDGQNACGILFNSTITGYNATPVPAVTIGTAGYSPSIFATGNLWVPTFVSTSAVYAEAIQTSGGGGVHVVYPGNVLVDNGGWVSTPILTVSSINGLAPGYTSTLSSLFAANPSLSTIVL